MTTNVQMLNNRKTPFFYFNVFLWYALIFVQKGRSCPPFVPHYHTHTYTHTHTLTHTHTRTRTPTHVDHLPLTPPLSHSRCQQGSNQAYSN